MKRVSVGLFFAVLWKGICQFLGSFFGLFGYKRDGRFAKIIWGIFATSAAVVMSIFALALVCALGEEGISEGISVSTPIAITQSMWQGTSTSTTQKMVRDTSSTS